MRHLDVLAPILADTLAPLAQPTDTEGRFPREVIQALGEAGLLGLVATSCCRCSAKEASSTR